jgi:hypothetical protein
LAKCALFTPHATVIKHAVHDTGDFIESNRDALDAAVRAKETAHEGTACDVSSLPYATFRDNGWPIGSGPIEAARKTLIKTRLCRSGMRWNRAGGQRILALRTDVKSGRWDNACAQHQETGASRMKPYNERYNQSSTPLKED